MYFSNGCVGGKGAIAHDAKVLYCGILKITVLNVRRVVISLEILLVPIWVDLRYL